MLNGNGTKLTLGLKKKSAENQSQANTKKRLKLTLGLQKSPDKSRNQEFPKFSSGLKPKFGPQVEKPQKMPSPQTSATLRMPKTQGKLEINIKISELPNWVEEVKHGWQRFCINVDGQIIQMMVRPRVWYKLLKANEEYPLWIASITGKMGLRIKNGFQLLEPAIQVYEKQAKKPKVEE